jgi:hypothetical protein
MNDAGSTQRHATTPCSKYLFRIPKKYVENTRIYSDAIYQSFSSLRK